MESIEITRIDTVTGEVHRMIDFVAEERPVHIFLGKTHFVTICCSPMNLKELAIGHLLSEGVVRSIEEIEEVNLKGKGEKCNVKLKPNIDMKKRLKTSKPFSRIILSACCDEFPSFFLGRHPRIESSLTVRAETILQCVNRLNTDAMLFRKTGGVHVAAVFGGDGNPETFTEDVGRHNAVDKAIGMGAIKKTDFRSCFLVLSGRLTGDIVLKAARVGLPIVASLAAAVDAGIAVARDTNVTLIGFVRGRRMNVYSLPERISV